MDVLRYHNERAVATSQVHTKAMNVLNGHHMLLSVYSLNFRINYCTMVNGVLVELWHDDHRVAGVYEGYGTISSGTMVRW